MLENAKNYFAPMHTAEHILNQTMQRMFNCERSFNNHIEKKKSKCDYHFDRLITSQEIAELSSRVNQTIALNLSVSEELISYDEASAIYDLSKLQQSDNQTIRVIKIGDYDRCVCSGEHVTNTNEIGLFTITSVTYENNVLRIRFKLA